MSKLLKKHKDLIIILAIFMLVLVFMVIISNTFAFFQISKTTNGEIILGELDYTINVNNISQTLLLPGDDIEIDVGVENFVKNKKELVPFYFRFKILNGEKNYDLNLINLMISDDYIMGNDFYYYKYKLSYGDRAKILNRITIDETLKKENIEDLNLSILVDAVQSEFGAYREVFYDAPIEWFKYIENY